MVEPGLVPQDDGSHDDHAAEVRSRDEFISLVGHEIRNSIAPLVMLAEQFEDSPTGIPPNRVAMLLRNLRRFVATVDRVTEVSQLLRGKVALEPAPVDLVEVVTEVLRELDAQANAGKIVFVVDMPDALVGTWTRQRIHQIVTHVVTNAIRYSGGGTVEIAVHDGDGAARLSVRDHGPGIPIGELDGLFDRFERPRTKTSGGFGIGLFVVGTVTKAMGGSVHATNASDGGACVSITLPRG